MHPLKDFLFCPHCGSKHFNENDPYSKRCKDCGFTFYPNSAAATVAVIINDKHELLCVKRDREPAKGTLDLPGGFVDPNESITDGLIREVREEVGAEVTAYDFLFSLPNIYPFSGHLVYTADSFFRCTIASTKSITAHDDAAAVMWIPLTEVDPNRFGLDSIRHGIEKLLKEH